MTLPSDNHCHEALNAYLEERGYNLEQKTAVRNLFEAKSLLLIAGQLQTEQLQHHKRILTSFTDWDGLPNARKCAGMKDIIQKIRSGTPNLKLICEAITQTKLSLDAAQNSLQSMIVVPPECTSVAVQTDPFLISSEGKEIVHDQTQTNDKTHVQHPFLKTSPQNNMKVPEQEEVCFEFQFEKAEKAMLAKWGGLAMKALGGQGPKMFGLPCVKEKKRALPESASSSDFQFQEASSTCLNGHQASLEKQD